MESSSSTKNPRIAAIIASVVPQANSARPRSRLPTSWRSLQRAVFVTLLFVLVATISPVESSRDCSQAVRRPCQKSVLIRVVELCIMKKLRSEMDAPSDILPSRRRSNFVGSGRHSTKDDFNPSYGFGYFDDGSSAEDSSMASFGDYAYSDPYRSTLLASLLTTFGAPGEMTPTSASQQRRSNHRRKALTEAVNQAPINPFICECCIFECGDDYIERNCPV